MKGDVSPGDRSGSRSVRERRPDLNVQWQEEFSWEEEQKLLMEN